jgi:hypothetical protein
MSKVYFLWESVPERDEQVLVGVFSSIEAAEAAKAEIAVDPRWPEDFVVEEQQLDEIYWRWEAGVEGADRDIDS